MKKILLSLLSVVMVLCATAGERTYTISFKDSGKTTDSGASHSATTPIEDVFSEGAEYVSYISAAVNAYPAKSGYGLKFSSSSNSGKIEFDLSNKGIGLVKKIVVNAAKFNNKEAANLSVNDKKISATDLSNTAANQAFNDYTIEYAEPTEVKTITLLATKRMYVKSISVTLEENTNGTPEVTLDGEKILEGEYEVVEKGVLNVYAEGADAIGMSVNGAEAEEIANPSEIVLEKDGQFEYVFQSLAGGVAVGDPVRYYFDVDDQKWFTDRELVGVASHDVTFDFTDFSSLNPSETFTPSTSTSAHINDVEFSNEDVVVYAGKGTNSDAQYFYYSSQKEYQYRVYKGAVLTVRSKGADIEKIEFVQRAGEYALFVGAPGSYSTKVYTAGDNSVKAVEFSVTTNAQIQKIIVTLKGNEHYAYTIANPKFKLNGVELESRKGVEVKGGDVIAMEAHQRCQIHFQHPGLGEAAVAYGPMKAKPVDEEWYTVDEGEAQHLYEYTVPATIPEDGVTLKARAVKGEFMSEPSQIVVKNGKVTSIEGVEAESFAGEVEYFNLQGIRVENPTEGLYIRREGNKVSKVVL